MGKRANEQNSIRAPRGETYAGRLSSTKCGATHTTTATMASVGWVARALGRTTASLPRRLPFERVAVRGINLTSDNYSDVLGGGDEDGGDGGPDVSIQGYDGAGFVVGNEYIRGAIFCYGSRYFAWDVPRASQITPDSLAAAEVVKPKPDILVIGCGSRTQMLAREVTDYLRLKRMGCEVGSTQWAISTYNVLRGDGRRVATFLIPFGAD